MDQFFADSIINLSKFDLLNTIMTIQFQLVFLVYILISAFFVYKTYFDARQRYMGRTVVLVWCMTVLLLNIIGYIIYLIVRPKELVNDQHINKLEKYFLEYETRGVGKCRVCRHIYFPEQTYCTNCGTLVRTNCNSCGNIIELEWNVCAYCGDVKKTPLGERKKLTKKLNSASNSLPLSTENVAKPKES